MKCSRDAARHWYCCILCAFALSLLALGACGTKKRTTDAAAQRGSVVRLVAPSTGFGLQICDPQGAACAQPALGSAVPAGSILRTAARSSAQIALEDGSAVALD